VHEGERRLCGTLHPGTIGDHEDSGVQDVRLCLKDDYYRFPSNISPASITHARDVGYRNLQLTDDIASSEHVTDLHHYSTKAALAVAPWHRLYLNLDLADCHISS
jgi:hypothetical protein